MRNSKLAFAAALVLSVAAVPMISGADELTVVSPDSSASPAVSVPAKGTARSTVLKSFGEPQKKHAPAGGDSPKHPPITRWDYAGFSVFFEHDHVVDAVVPGRPAQVYHTDKLKPVSAEY